MRPRAEPAPAGPHGLTVVVADAEDTRGRRWWRSGFRSGVSTICVFICYLALPAAFIPLFHGGNSSPNVSDLVRLLLHLFRTLPFAVAPLGALAAIVGYVRTGRRQFVFELLGLGAFWVWWASSFG